MSDRGGSKSIKVDRDRSASRDGEVLRLVASGLSRVEVARELGVTVRGASTLITRAVSRAASAGLDRDQTREVEAAHLAMLRAALLPAALEGDVAAVRVLVRIHSARAVLLGLADEPPAAAPPAPAGEVTELDRIRANRAARRGASG